jgi:hypothetical protein
VKLQFVEYASSNITELEMAGKQKGDLEALENLSCLQKQSYKIIQKNKKIKI